MHSAPALHPVVGFKSLAIAYYFGNVFVDLLIYEAVIKHYLNTAGILSDKRCTSNFVIRQLTRTVHSSVQIKLAHVAPYTHYT